MATTTGETGLRAHVHRTGVARLGKQLARRVIDGVIERHLRINCVAKPIANASGHYADSVDYTACDYPFLIKCLNAMGLGADDVAFDIGCGRGRALCLMARRGVRKAVGIELSEELAAGARANVASMRPPKSPVDVLVTDAAFADYAEGTAFYLFNPFGGETMRAVLARIREGVAARPRAVRIMYLNPFHDDVFAAAGWLRKVKDVRSVWSNTWASYWVSEGAGAS